MRGGTAGTVTAASDLNCVAITLKSEVKFDRNKKLREQFCLVCCISLKASLEAF